MSDGPCQAGVAAGQSACAKLIVGLTPPALMKPRINTRVSLMVRALRDNFGPTRTSRFQHHMRSKLFQASVQR